MINRAPVARRSMSEKTIMSLTEKEGRQMRVPFVPTTGNPENGDYADWSRALRTNKGTSVHPLKKPSDKT
jgi:hypothetical protein